MNFRLWQQLRRSTGKYSFFSAFCSGISGCVSGTRGASIAGDASASAATACFARIAVECQMSAAHGDCTAVRCKHSHCFLPLSLQATNSLLNAQTHNCLNPIYFKALFIWHYATWSDYELRCVNTLEQHVTLMFRNESTTHKNQILFLFKKRLKSKHVVLKERATKCQAQMAFVEKGSFSIR